MNRFGKILLCSLFICFIFIFGIYKLASPDHEISEFENRKLAQKNDFSVESFLDGSFMEDFEAYFTDQFPGRNTWLKAYTDYQLFLNKTYVSNFYISADNYIIPKPGYSFKAEQYKRSAEHVNQFAEYLRLKDIETYYFSLPHKATILQFLYPNYIQEGEQRRRSEYLLSHLDKDVVTTVDLNSIWMENFTEEEIKDMYFQTDHHWNIQGAFQAYKNMAQTFLNQSNYFVGSAEDLEEENYALHCVPSDEPFLGSYNRQLYMRVSHNDQENMCTFISDDFSDYTVELNGEEVEPFSIYATALVNYEEKENIAYKDIFSDDERNITIINHQKKDAGNILVVKDSYANPLLYLIAQNFYKTTFYDIRYNLDRTVKEFIDARDYNVVAILYNNTQLQGEFFEFGVE